jgi:hypothetical protein
MRTLLSVVCLTTLVGAHNAAAQSEQDITAYFALLGTPIGALPPVLSNAMLNRPMPSAVDFRVRYGHISMTGASMNNFAATIGIPASQKTMFGVTAGYESVSCDRCDGHFMAGANVESRLASTLLGAGSDAAQINIGVNGEFGFGHPSGTTLATLTGGLPISLVTRTSGISIAPFLTPGIGWGHARDDATSEGGTRFLLGGGVTFQSTTSPIAANIGFQKIFIDGGDTVIGLSLVLGGR